GRDPDLRGRAYRPGPDRPALGAAGSHRRPQRVDRRRGRDRDLDQRHAQLPGPVAQLHRLLDTPAAEDHHHRAPGEGGVEEGVRRGAGRVRGGHRAAPVAPLACEIACAHSRSAGTNSRSCSIGTIARRVVREMPPTTRSPKPKIGAPMQLMKSSNSASSSDQPRARISASSRVKAAGVVIVFAVNFSYVTRLSSGLSSGSSRYARTALATAAVCSTTELPTCECIRTAPTPSILST